jgi:shikimate kinase
VIPKSLSAKRRRAQELEENINMEHRRNIILCGFMGTGKTSVGKCLATMTQYDFMDLDAVIEEEAGISIPQIFASQGEPAFRKLESLMVERVAEKTGCVIATGGGTIVNPQNLEKLKCCGVVITLAADISTILHRVGSGDDRPMLKSADRLQRIQSLMEQRASAYAQADMMVDTSTLSIDEVAQGILNRLREIGFCFDGKA